MAIHDLGARFPSESEYVKLTNVSGSPLLYPFHKVTVWAATQITLTTATFPSYLIEVEQLQPGEAEADRTKLTTDL